MNAPSTQTETVALALLSLVLRGGTGAEIRVCWELVQNRGTLTDTGRLYQLDVLGGSDRKPYHVWLKLRRPLT